MNEEILFDLGSVSEETKGTAGGENETELSTEFKKP